MNETITLKTAPEWVCETFGATALELGLYADDDAVSPSGERPIHLRPAVRREDTREAWMAEKENIAVVQKAYAAFQNGDVPGLLELVAENVEWEGVKGVPPSVPFAGLRRGRAQVAEFFALVGREEEFSRFEPQEFFASGNRVVALGSYDARVHRTGKSFAGDWAMAFTIENGKIVRFTEYADSYGIAKSFD